ncbi:MAG: two-component sensor histidine kinase [Desulfovibrionaceae bacterium]|nr:two-component sensor histidine kinase [Desulfovibrionaceae bacterium]
MQTQSQFVPGYRSLYWRLLATFLLLSLIPLIALGVFSLRHIDAMYNEKISASLEAVTSSKRRALDTFLSERIAQIRIMAFTHSYEELVDVNRLSRLFSVMQQSSQSFVDIGIIGMDGQHVAYVGPFDLKNANYANTEWFNEVQHKGIVVTDVFLGFRKSPHFIIAVLRHEGEKSFILRATIDMAVLQTLLRREYSGKHAEAFLVNRQGTLQTDSLFHGEMMQSFPLPDMSRTSQGIILFPLQDAQKKTSEDSYLQAALMPLSTMPWLLVVVDDANESLHSLHQLQILISIFMLGGTLAIVLGAVFCTRGLIGFLKSADEEKKQIDARMLQSSKMAALGKMAAGVAHEVNNPLMLIQENAGWIRDLLDEEKKENIANFDEIVKSCEKIESHVKRAKGITQRMLGFGRRMNPGRTEILLNSLADDACEMLRAEATQRNIVIEKDYDVSLPVIYSDPAQLEQVFINIIDNALDAIGRDGRIAISTARAGEGVSIIITDNGPGMDEATKARIFDPFFTTKKVGEGTGLGLAICFSILEKLGGHVDVQSILGEGTTFTITLPHEPPVVSE